MDRGKKSCMSFLFSTSCLPDVISEDKMCLVSILRALVPTVSEHSVTCCAVQSFVLFMSCPENSESIVSLKFLT